MATQTFFRTGMVCSIIAFVAMVIAFASPFWYKSWTRVHSPLANIGLWHVCLSGWIIPRDPIMKSYVGCWWIHSTEFERVANEIMPPWFRIIQFLCFCTIIIDLVAMVFILLYLIPDIKKKLYKDTLDKTGRMFIIIAALMLISAFLVFLIALIFAEMSNDGSWMPRPWMNYLSWSYASCVMSGFFAAFGGMVIFILGLLFKDKARREEEGIPPSAAEMIRPDDTDRARRKEEEAMAMPYRGQTEVPPTRFTPQEPPFAAQQPRFGAQETRFRGPPVAPKPQHPEARVGESFV